MGGVRYRQPPAHQSFFYALPYHFLKQPPEHLPKRGFPPPQLADRAVIRHPFIQINTKIPAKRVAVRAPLLNLPLRGDTVQKAYQQILYYDHRVNGRTAILPAVQVGRFLIDEAQIQLCFQFPQKMILWHQVFYRYHVIFQLHPLAPFASNYIIFPATLGLFCQQTQVETHFQPILGAKIVLYCRLIVIIDGGWRVV